MNYVAILKEKFDKADLWEKEVTIDRNEYLKVGGSIDTNLYYIIDGTLRVFTISDHEEHTIRFGYRENLIAALDSFISGNPSPFYIQALKRTHLKAVSRTECEKLMRSSTENLVLWNEILNRLVLELMEREQDILIASPLERYHRVLKRSPQLFQEIPHKYIASYLRMTPETLSRIKSLDLNQG